MIGGTHSNYWCIIVPLEILVLLVYLMGIAAFAGLFWHIGNMIDLLNPENIIKRLSENITRENVLEYIKSIEENKKDKTKPIVKDPIQPIVDVIHGAVMKYDIATTRYGLKAITEKAIEVVRSDYLFSCGYLFSWDDVSGNDSNKLLEYLIDKFGIDWAKLKDIRKSDEKTITISEGGNSVEITLDGDKENATKATLKIISDGIIYDLKVRMENGKLNIYHSDYEIMTSRHFCAHLERVGKLALSREDDESVIKVLESLESFGESTAEKRLKGAPFQAARSLGVVGKIIAENGLEDATKQVARSLECIGKLTAENGLGAATFEVTKSLGVILKIVAENGRGDVTKQVARYLGVVGIVVYDRMVAAEKEGKQEEREELNRRVEEVAEHLAKLSMSLEESKEILLGARSDTKKLYIGSESFNGFLEIYNDAVDNLKNYEPNHRILDANDSS
jgi:hypothetical protein